MKRKKVQNIEQNNLQGAITTNQNAIEKLYGSAYVEDINELEEFSPSSNRADGPKMVFDELEKGICSVADSLSICVSRKGCVNIYYMAWISGSTEDEVLAEHGNKTIFQIPEEYMQAKTEQEKEYEHWVLPVQYLSGNLHALRKSAVKANEELNEELNQEFNQDANNNSSNASLNRFEPNIKLIDEALPEMVEFDDINVQIGAGWIREKYIAAFLVHLFKLRFKPTVKKCDGRWQIKINGPISDVLNNTTYGTRRMKGTKIFEHTLNSSSIKITDDVPADNKTGTKKMINRYETYAAQAKQQLIIKEFSDWLRNDISINKVLRKEYYEKFSFCFPRYDGSYLELNDLDPGVELYKHQKDAIARIILSHNVALCHDVGSGKTFCYVIGVHELYRLGISRKNMIVVPNNVFSDAVETHKLLYPNDKIMEISPDDFTAKDRLETLNKIKYGNYVAIYIAASKFDMLDMSQEFYDKQYYEEYFGLADVRDEKKRQGDDWSVRVLESKMKSIAEKRNKFFESHVMTEKNCFDKLGITTLVVDEAHNYKNLSIKTNFENVIGMSKAGSKKADLLKKKVECIQEVNGRVIFATGTLLTNSIADLYAFQEYLQLDTLRESSIHNFGEWANTFGSISTSFEIDVDSQNYRYMTRLSHYHNLPELMNMFSEVCDFYHITDEDMDVPTFSGYEDVVVNKTLYNDNYNKEIAERTDNVRKGIVSNKEDNILKIVTDGRKCALDVRLVIPNAAVFDKDCKVGACAQKVLKIYNEHPGKTQIVFCDYSTPKNEFNVYGALRSLLIKGGISSEEIAFIQDGTTEFKKNKLLKALDQGKIRVMLGSTQKLGVGVNVQSRLIAVHHLDAPWRPSDLSQREGRLIRQGNMNEQVFIYRYMTSGSFDSYVWQILQNKRHFIGSFLAGTMHDFHRDESEIDAVMLDYSEVKALAIGNPIIRERIETYNKLERAKLSNRQRHKQLVEMQQLLPQLDSAIRDCKYTIYVVGKDMEYFRDNKESMDNASRKEFGEELSYALSENVNVSYERLFFKYMGFNVMLPKNMNKDERYVLVTRPGGGTYKVDMADKDSVNMSRAIDGTLNGLSKRRDALQRKLLLLNQQVEESKAMLKEGNPYEKEVEALELRLEEIDTELNPPEEKAV